MDAAINAAKAALVAVVSSLLVLPGLGTAEAEQIEANNLQSLVDSLPGSVIFEGAYTHSSGGQMYPQPASLCIREQGNGAINAVAKLPFDGTAYVATADANHQLKEYRVTQAPSEGEPGNEQTFRFGRGGVRRTRLGGPQDEDKRALGVPPGALFYPDSRPDPYCVLNLHLRPVNMNTGQVIEFDVYDVDSTGEGFAPYRIQVEYTGQEIVDVPAGQFQTARIRITQLTSADTWFKKQVGDVTDLWLSADNIIIKIVRHREPYVVELLTYTSPGLLPGHVEDTREEDGSLLIVSAAYGARDRWVDVTEQLQERVQDDTLSVRVSGDLVEDLIPGVAKRLSVWYRLDGIAQTAAANDGELLQIPAPPAQHDEGRVAPGRTSE